MKNIFNKFTVMSIALVLFCVSAVAQNENQTRSVTDVSHGVTVPNNNITIRSYQYENVSFSIDPGYRDPLLIYAGENFEISDRVVYGRNFVAIIMMTDDSNGYIQIIADPDIDVATYDTVYIKAQIGNGNNESSRSATTDYYGVPIYITLLPSLGN